MRGECKGGLSKNIVTCNAFREKLWGIYEGLTLTKRLGMVKVELNVDSNVIVKIFESRKLTDIDGYSLIKKIYNLMEMHEEVKVVHSYMETNLCADVLAKVVADNNEDIFFQEDIPVFIKRLTDIDVKGTRFPRLVML